MIESILVVPQEFLFRRVEDGRINFAADHFAWVLAVLSEQVWALRFREPFERVAQLLPKAAEKNRAVSVQIGLDELTIARSPLNQINLVRQWLDNERQL